MTDARAPQPLMEGIAAWQRGDYDGLAQVLHPHITLKAVSPGPWDCHGVDAVITLLRTRGAQRHDDAPSEVSIERIDASRYLVRGLGAPGTITAVTLAQELIVSLQQISVDPVEEGVPQRVEQAVAAVRAGDLSALADVLDSTPSLARQALPGHQGRTLLHIVTDWPGYWPQGPATVALLLGRGADPNHRGGSNDWTGETPLHWAASSDDVAVAAALIQGGADLEAPDGSIGTPLDNAIGYGCWAVARLLVDRGATVCKLWHAAALGDLDRLETLLTAGPAAEDINQAFWHACDAAQRRAAQRLLDAGADLSWSPNYAEGNALDAACGPSTQQDNVVDWLISLGLSPTSAEDKSDDL